MGDPHQLPVPHVRSRQQDDLHHDRELPNCSTPGALSRRGFVRWAIWPILIAAASWMQMAPKWSRYRVESSRRSYERGAQGSVVFARKISTIEDWFAYMSGACTLRWAGDSLPCANGPLRPERIQIRKARWLRT